MKQSIVVKVFGSNSDKANLDDLPIELTFVIPSKFGITSKNTSTFHLDLQVLTECHHCIKATVSQIEQ